MRQKFSNEMPSIDPFQSLLIERGIANAFRDRVRVHLEAIGKVNEEASARGLRIEFKISADGTIVRFDVVKS